MQNGDGETKQKRRRCHRNHHHRHKNRATIFVKQLQGNHNIMCTNKWRRNSRKIIRNVESFAEREARCDVELRWSGWGEEKSK